MTAAKTYRLHGWIWLGIAGLALVLQYTDSISKNVGPLYVMAAIIISKLNMVHASVVEGRDE